MACSIEISVLSFLQLLVCFPLLIIESSPPLALVLAITPICQLGLAVAA